MPRSKSVVLSPGSSPGHPSPISKEDALRVFLGLPPSHRSGTNLIEACKATFGAAPCRATLSYWRRSEGWDELARLQQEETTRRVIEINAARGADVTVARADRLDSVVDDAISRVQASMPEIEIKTADDLLKIARMIVELQTRADIMRGGVSDRTEHTERRSVASVNLSDLLSRYEGE